jgi:hypothetical protein
MAAVARLQVLASAQAPAARAAQRLEQALAPVRAQVQARVPAARVAQRLEQALASARVQAAAAQERLWAHRSRCPSAVRAVGVRSERACR